MLVQHSGDLPGPEPGGHVLVQIAMRNGQVKGAWKQTRQGIATNLILRISEIRARATTFVVAVHRETLDLDRMPSPLVESRFDQVMVVGLVNGHRGAEDRTPGTDARAQRDPQAHMARRRIHLHIPELALRGMGRIKDRLREGALVCLRPRGQGQQQTGCEDELRAAKEHGAS